MASNSEGGRPLGECNKIVVLGLGCIQHAFNLVVEDSSDRRLIHRAVLTRFDETAGKGKGAATMRHLLDTMLSPVMEPKGMHAMPEEVHRTVHNPFYASATGTDPSELEGPAEELIVQVAELEMNNRDAASYPFPVKHVKTTTGKMYGLLVSAVIDAFGDTFDIKFQMDEASPPKDWFTRSRNLPNDQKVWVRAMELVEDTIIRYWCENLTKAVIDPAFRTFYVVRNGLLVEISAAEYAELAALKGLQD